MRVQVHIFHNSWAARPQVVLGEVVAFACRELVELQRLVVAGSGAGAGVWALRSGDRKGAVLPENRKTCVSTRVETKYIYIYIYIYTFIRETPLFIKQGYQGFHLLGAHCAMIQPINNQVQVTCCMESDKWCPFGHDVSKQSEPSPYPILKGTHLLTPRLKFLPTYHVKIQLAFTPPHYASKTLDRAPRQTKTGACI